MSICKFILFTHAEPGFGDALGGLADFGRTVVSTTVKNAVINKAAGAVHEAIIGKNDKSSTDNTTPDNTKKWRDEDLRCGESFPLENGKPSECDPSSKYPCCGASGWCGSTSEHCDGPSAASKIGGALLKTTTNLLKKAALGPIAPFADPKLIGNALSTTKKLITGVAKVPYALVTAPIKTTKTVLETGARAVVHTAKSAIKDPKLITLTGKSLISGKPSVGFAPFGIRHATSGIDQALDDVAGQLDPKNLTRRNLRNGDNRKKITTVLKNGGKEITTVLKNGGKVVKEAAKSAGKVVKEAAKSAGRVGKATVKSAVKDPKVLALAAGSLISGVPNPALVPLVAGHLAEGISDVEAAGQRTLYV